MVKFELTGSHQLIILNIEGKSPIRVSAGSMAFHNANDLLCCSLAACVGNYMKRFCMWENLDPQQFESFKIHLENSTLHIQVQCPKELDDKIKLRLKRDLTDCSVGRLLANRPKVELIENETPTEELVKKEPKRCCGE